MKKILLFAVALLGSLSMMAASFLPGEAFDVQKDTVIYGNYFAKLTSAATANNWAVDQSVGFKTDKSFTAVDSYVKSTASGDTTLTLKGSPIAPYKISSTGRTLHMRVHNVSSVSVYGIASSDNRGFKIHVSRVSNITSEDYELPLAKDSILAKKNSFVLTIDTLDYNQEYVISVRASCTGTTDSEVYLHAVRFVAGNATPIVKHTVNYYDGSNLLGTETVKEGETPTTAAQYETKPHATFNGWYNDNGLTVLANLADPITADKDFYGKWTADAFTASTSINIEQGVLDNGKAWDVASALTTAHIAYGDIDELDSLSTKEGRNEPFLGLKLKTAGAYVEAGLNAGDVIRVKFGNVAADVKINGATVAKATLATPYEYTATAQEYVRIETTTGGTVVLKQIMINQPIADVVLPTVDNDVTLATLTLDGVTIPGFNASTKTYTITLEEGTTLPVVAATAKDANATVGTITQATTLPGDASFVVTAADGTTTATYTIHFVLPREIKYLTAPYETTIPADFVMPDWLTGCTVNTAYMGADTVVAGHDVIRFEKTDTVSMYINSCDSVIVDLSATGTRTVAIAVNGEEKANSGSFNKNNIKTLGALIHSEGQVIVNIYGVDVTGGTTISRIKVTAYDPLTPTATEYMEAAPKAVKRIINGQLFIEKNGVLYNALGAKL